MKCFHSVGDFSCSKAFYEDIKVSYIIASAFNRNVYK